MTPQSLIRGAARRLRRLLGLQPKAAHCPVPSPGSQPKSNRPAAPRPRAPRPPPIKIAVIGNCQRTPLAYCLNKLAYGVTAEPFSRSETSLKEQLETNDFVVVQPFASDEIGALPPEQRAKIISVPRFYFPAFHPDLIQNRALSSPIARRGLNSGIALYGWLRNLTVDDTVELYCGEVFERLGFFDSWDISKRLLLKEGKNCGMPLDAMFDTWQKTGCFVYHPVHPKPIVSADLARTIIARLGRRERDKPIDDLRDFLARGSQWPVYPEIAARLGFEGSYDFTSPSAGGRVRQTLSLHEFVAASFEIFEQHQPDKSSFSELQWQNYQQIDTLPSSKKGATSRWTPNNPYSKLPDEQFWRQAVANIPAGHVDPVTPAPFHFDKQTRIATAGSCFAQNIARALSARGFNYYVTETAPPEMPTDEASARGFGMFSARYGNIYTARQLLQLFDRAFGSSDPYTEIWKRPDGRYVDPFRPRIEPDGFDTVDAMMAERERHLATVKHMFEHLDIFVFTLGLTEAWRTRASGAVLPLAPGVVASSMNPTRHEFVNFSVADVALDLERFVKRLRRVNPPAKIILTVSPVPLVATYENRHVLSATTYSKSVLRVAAEDVARSMEDVWYFPSYEIITGNFNRGAYFEKDLRSITAEGVDHVMRLFFAHGARDAAAEVAVSKISEDRVDPMSVRDIPVTETLDTTSEAAREADAMRGFEIVCDEEELEKSAA